MELTKTTESSGGMNRAGGFLRRYADALMGVGVLGLLVTMTRSFRSRYTSHEHLGIELCGALWQFQVLLWLVIFLALSIGTR